MARRRLEWRGVGRGATWLPPNHHLGDLLHPPPLPRALTYPLNSRIRPHPILPLTFAKMEVALSLTILSCTRKALSISFFSSSSVVSSSLRILSRTDLSEVSWTQSRGEVAGGGEFRNDAGAGS